MRLRLLALLTNAPPSRALGGLAAVLLVAATTGLLYPLKGLAPVVSLGVLYLLGVLVLSIVWGAWLGVPAAVLSAVAFNFFHIPPTGQFTIQDPENWVALITFLVASVVASSVAQVARQATREAEHRRREADLSAEMAGLLLRGGELGDTLPSAARRLAASLGLPSAAIELSAVQGDERRTVFPLREAGGQIGTLVVDADLPDVTLRRLQERVVPALEALLAAALEREALQGESVESRALRRSDIMKTALLRAVSHDLRSPLTAITTAAAALSSERVSDAERRELAAVAEEEAARLSKLVDNLLDLSRLEAGAAEPELEWCSLEEVITGAVDSLGPARHHFRLEVRADLPLIRADAAQLERAFANLFANSARHSGGHPVLVRAFRSAHRILVRVVDRGPGIPRAHLERVFEPFYREPGDDADRGSGLGLAITRGFVEANGGRVTAESLPGQGATFIVELPLPAEHEGSSSTEGGLAASPT